MEHKDLQKVEKIKTTKELMEWMFSCKWWKKHCEKLEREIEEVFDKYEKEKKGNHRE